MTVISSKVYAKVVTDYNEEKLCDCVWGLYLRLCRRYGFEPCSNDEFVDMFYGEYGSDIHEIVLEMFGMLGIDLEPDGERW